MASRSWLDSTRTRPRSGWAPGAAVIVGLTLLLCARTASSNDALIVRRGSYALDCPVTETLAEMVRRLTARAPVAEVATMGTVDRIEVDFSRTASGYRAELQLSGTKSGTRVLEHPSSTCGPMAEATALTLAVLVDPDFVPPAEPTLPAPQLPQQREDEHPDRSTDRTLDTRLYAGGGVAAGILREASPIVLLGGAIASGPLSVTISAMAIPPQTLDLSPGTVDVWLLSGSLGGCFSPIGTSTWRAFGCAGFQVGALRGTAHGFTKDSDATRPWLAADAHLLAQGSIRGALGWFARVGVVVPLERESFKIDGAGVAYAAPPAAFVAAIGPALTFR